MAGIIIYKGKYGATEQYADWLAEELHFPEFSADALSPLQLKDYDVLLIGSSVYVGKLMIADWIKHNQMRLKDKKIFLFVVSGTPSHEKEKLDLYTSSCLPEEIRKNCEIYYLPGRMILKNLSWKDRFILKMGARLAKDPNERKRILADFDNVNKEHLVTMIDAVKQTIVSGKMALPA